ncbi:MAG: flagellar biosynthesis regulatory protein FlaF [Alphaproteobacteria bacterium]|nr:MAG: flagellar biosynthesis regulatory protein FlaF [Alphaproteobacteria bacterium]
MSRSAYATSAYAETGRTQLAPRRIEYQAFARITHRLSRAAEGGRAEFPRLAAAVNDNLALWRVLALDLADPDNALPEDLRASLLSLAIFTLRHSDAVLAGRAAPDALVDINTALMRGLRGAGAAEEAAAEGAAEGAA